MTCFADILAIRGIEEEEAIKPWAIPSSRIVTVSHLNHPYIPIHEHPGFTEDGQWLGDQASHYEIPLEALVVAGRWIESALPGVHISPANDFRIEFAQPFNVLEGQRLCLFLDAEIVPQSEDLMITLDFMWRREFLASWGEETRNQGRIVAGTRQLTFQFPTHPIALGLASGPRLTLTGRLEIQPTRRVIAVQRLALCAYGA